MMETAPSSVKNFLDGQLLEALQAPSSESLPGLVASYAWRQDATAAWLQTIGSRLEIKDLFMDQLIGVQSLITAADQALDAPITGTVRSYIQDLDQRIQVLAPATDDEQDGRRRQADRISRVAQEQPDALADLLNGFCQEPLERVQQVDDQLRRVSQERDGIVERLDAAIQTDSEGDTSVARQELRQALPVIIASCQHVITSAVLPNRQA